MEMFIIPIVLILVSVVLLILQRNGNIRLKKYKIILWAPGIVGVLWIVAIVLILIIIALLLP